MSIQRTFRGRHSRLSLGEGLRFATDFWANNTDAIIGGHSGTVELLTARPASAEILTAQTNTARYFLQAFCSIMQPSVLPVNALRDLEYLDHFRPDPNGISQPDHHWLICYRDPRYSGTGHRRQRFTARLLGILSGHPIQLESTAQEITAAALTRFTAIERSVTVS